MTTSELCREGWQAEHQVLEENKTTEETVVHDETNLVGVTIENASSSLLPEALPIIKGVTTNRHVEEEGLEETAHRFDDEPHTLQSLAGSTHFIATPHLQLQEIMSCSLQNTIACASPQIPPHRSATYTTHFGLTLAQELGAQGETTGSENRTSQLQVGDLAVPKQGTLLKWNQKKVLHWKTSPFPAQVSQQYISSESLHCTGCPSPAKAPVRPVLPRCFRHDAAGLRSEQAPTGTPAPKGRCFVNSYFINPVNCDKRAIKILVPLKLFFHLEQLYHQKMLHIALYTELAALDDYFTALLNNRYKNHRSLKTTN